MSDAPPRSHNLPDLTALLGPDVIKALIAYEMEDSPLAPDETRVPSLEDRDRQLKQMCHRFIRAYPKIINDEGARIATDVLNTCQKFIGRIENARTKFKAPVLAAGRQIDEAFGKLGAELNVRPLTGPPRGRRIAPLSLAEQISNLQIGWVEAEDERKREEAAAKAKQLEDEAQVARDLAAKGSSVVTAEDAEQAEAEAAKQRQIAAAPMNKLTRTSGNMTGSTSGKRVRTFEIVDASLVPRQFCSPDDRLIRDGIGAADSPIPTIPGLIIKDVTDLNRR